MRQPGYIRLPAQVDQVEVSPDLVGPKGEHYMA
jgi:hypothetical protein